MRNLPYIVAVAFVILWAIGFFVYDTGYVVHYLLVLGMISILVRVIPPDKKSNY